MKTNKKELIREAALKVIAKEGFYNTKTSKIAEEAEVAVGTIYNYFESKDEILEYIFEVEFEKRIEMLKKMKNKESTIFEKLSLFMKSHFDEVKNNLDTAQILVREKEFPKSRDFSAILNYLNEIPILLEEMLEEAMSKGEIKKQNTSITAALIFGGLQGIVEKALRTDSLELLDNAEEEVIKILKEGV
ncbi:MAG: TetR/AcrR family transcriptional regulator [Halanaerobiales bacterium]|nr:TetR/AcrR family transcriptional regulator [Halanaerobiales bacterium]